MKKAICAGTFDPFTNGHLQMIEPMLKIADQVILAIGTNPGKHPIFTLDERIEMLYEISKPYGNRVVVDQFTKKYQVDYAVSRGASFIFRGLRDVKDFKEEQGWINFNYRKDPTLAQLFLMPPEKYATLSSSKVRKRAEKPDWEQEVQKWVPEPSYRKMLEKYNSPVRADQMPLLNIAKIDEPRKKPLRGAYVSRFDPWTNMHEWIVSRALDIVDELVLGISKDAYKDPTFNRQEIQQLIEGEIIRPYGNMVRLGSYEEEHRVDFAAKVGAHLLIRDIKSDDEFMEEKEKAMRNYETNPDITQVFIIPPTDMAEQTSMRIKQLIGPPGWHFDGWQKEVEPIVPKPIYYALLEKYDEEFRKYLGKTK